FLDHISVWYQRFPHIPSSLSEQVKLFQINGENTGEVIQSPPDFRKEFPGLFEQLEKLKTEHHITLRDDATPLNKTVKREVHTMPSVDESISKLGQGKVFSKLDANSGFWQVPLNEQSRLLTTFITPFGRFCFNRLLFGICSAPEIFQRTMFGILEGLNGTICQMDDVLIGGKDHAQHDERDAGLTLDEKCEFSKESIKFLAHVIDNLGIHIDPDKTTAIVKFPTPKNVTELQRFLGMVNHVGKFVPRLADLNVLFRQLLHKDAVWTWEAAHQTAFLRINELLMSSEVLAGYDPRKETIVAADASAISELEHCLSRYRRTGTVVPSINLCFPHSIRNREAVRSHRERSPCSDLDL
ncbi:Hypothetical predicted protein, partial [Paramuricea clavata]